MASIVIKEKDYTQSTAYSATDTVVYIPGMLGLDESGQEPSSASEVIGKPILVDNNTDFEAYFGVRPRACDESDSEQVIYDKSFVMAKQLVNRGVSVLYEAVAQNSAAVTSRETMRSILGTDDHWSKLEDRATYNIKFLTSGGYHGIEKNGSTITKAIADAMAKAAADRGDCTALIDHNIDLVDAATIKSLFANGFDNGEYCACVTPWAKFGITCDLGDITESTDGYWTLPGSFSYVLAFTNMLSENESWMAASGASRGYVPLMIAPLAEFGEKICNSLQSREEGAVACNPITYVAPYGYRLYGNRTLKQNVDGLKAQNFLNIRQLISDIKKTVFQACRIMAFEQNTDVTWYNLKSKITPILDKMAAGSGIRGYKIERVSTDERAKVVGTIRILPIEAVEDFEITIELADSLEEE